MVATTPELAATTAAITAIRVNHPHSEWEIAMGGGKIGGKGLHLHFDSITKCTQELYQLWYSSISLHKWWSQTMDDKHSYTHTYTHSLITFIHTINEQSNNRNVKESERKTNFIQLKWLKMLMIVNDSIVWLLIEWDGAENWNWIF